MNTCTRANLRVHVVSSGGRLFDCGVINLRTSNSDYFLSKPTIHYIVVDTRNWWPGKKVLISPEWINNVSWTDSTVYVEMTPGAIKNAPKYDASRPIDRDYEAGLHDYYGRQGHWSNNGLDSSNICGCGELAMSNLEVFTVLHTPKSAPEVRTAEDLE